MAYTSAAGIVFLVFGAIMALVAVRTLEGDTAMKTAVTSLFLGLSFFGVSLAVWGYAQYRSMVSDDEVRQNQKAILAKLEEHDERLVLIQKALSRRQGRVAYRQLAGRVSKQERRKG